MPPLSHRFPWDAPSNRLARAFSARRDAGLPIYDLSVSNPTQAGIPLFPAHLTTASDYRPSSSGAELTRAAICRYYAEEFGVSLDPARILLTASTSEAYSYCFKLIADPGHAVLLPQPSYPLLEFLVRAEGLEPIPYPIHETPVGWVIDRDYVSAHCNARTRAIVVVNPNNPTGHVLTTDDAAWLASLAADRCWVLSDEVFADYLWHPQPNLCRTLAGPLHRNGFCLSGLSKVCGLPQMKLGWIVLPEGAPLRAAMELVADTYLSVSTPIQEAAAHWLAHRAEFQAPLRARCQENLHLLAQPVTAGWTAIVPAPSSMDPIDEEDLVLRLLAHGYWLQPGFYYDLPRSPRLVTSLLASPPHLAEALALLTSF